MIPYGKQEITAADINAVVDVLKSDFLTQGLAVPNFEKVIANYVGAEHAIACNSATSALHIACLALGLTSGDYLWTSPISFVASSNCALYCGAMVDFVDIDPKTYNLSPVALLEKLEQAEKLGKLPKVVVVVHFAGQSCDMEKIYQLSERYGFKIIEDASHAIGGRYKDKLIGGCNFSDVTIFSFHPVKIITTGEGGIAVTNSLSLASKMQLYRTHGITRDPKLMSQHSRESWYYEQIELGFNYRMTDIQAALGTSQAQRIDQYIEIRHNISNKYSQELLPLPVKLPWQSPDCYSALHLYVIRLRLSEVKKSRDMIFNELRNLGIGVNFHYIPIYKQPYYRLHQIGAGDYPESESYYSEAISLPIFPTLSSLQQNYIIQSLGKVLS